MTVIRRPADDVETWMNIQRRKNIVCISLWVFYVCVCLCESLCRISKHERVHGASEQSCYGIIFTTDLSRGALQLKLLGKNAPMNTIPKTADLLLFKKTKTNLNVHTE